MMMRRAVLRSAIIAAVVAGCTPGTFGPRGPDRVVIGTLGAVGPNVFVNRARAQEGMTIFSGDELSTGQGSSAMVAFSEGGFFQIDENTDPSFYWTAFEGFLCIVVHIAEGQAYGDHPKLCIDTGPSDAAMGSEVNIRATRQEVVFTLLRGGLTITRPQRIALVPGQEATADAGASGVRVRSLPPAELQERVTWRAQYRFRGWCRDERGESRSSFFDECRRGQFSFASPQRDPREPIVPLFPTPDGTRLHPSAPPFAEPSAPPLPPSVPQPSVPSPGRRILRPGLLPALPQNEPVIR